jgi:hypothetical protein
MVHSQSTLQSQPQRQIKKKTPFIRDLLYFEIAISDFSLNEHIFYLKRNQAKHHHKKCFKGDLSNNLNRDLTRCGYVLFSEV